MSALTNNAVHSVDAEKYLFLLNDLTAARWVGKIDPELPDELLAKKFLEIHEIFLGRLGRREKGFFTSVPHHKLVAVVRGWIRLYQCTLNLLKDQYPRSPNSRDLLINGINWSALLEISASGLLVIDHSSRYAELWAERSLKTRDAYSTLDNRISFVGTHVYNEYSHLVRSGKLLILDGFSNGVTSYDLMSFLDSTNCSSESFVSEIENVGWTMELGDGQAINLIFDLFFSLDKEHLHNHD